MKEVLLTLILIFGLTLSFVPQFSTTHAGFDQKISPYNSKPSNDALKWTNKELSKMSIEEKVGQLISVGINATFLNQESEAFKTLKRQVEQNHIGGIILFRGPVYESVILVKLETRIAP